MKKLFCRRGGDCSLNRKQPNQAKNRIVSATLRVIARRNDEANQGLTPQEADSLDCFVPRNDAKRRYAKRQSGAERL